jgi:uncharacterized repeat protein (TIGR01451 family)
MGGIMLKRVLTLAGSILFGLAIVCGLLWLLAARANVVQAGPPPGCRIIDQDFTTDTTLTDTCYYFVTDTVAIQLGVVVTIAPPIGGTLLEFQPKARLQVLGNLQTLGTDSRPITFTSANASPQPCDWQGIILESSSVRNRIQYSIIEYACTGVEISGIIDPNGGNWIVSNTFRYNGNGQPRHGAIGNNIDYSHIEYNVIYSSSNGIALNEAGYNSIAHNVIRDISGFGLILMRGGVGGGSNNVIADNDIHHAISGGLRLEDGSNNQVLGNLIYLNPGGGIYLQDQSSTSVQGNHIYANGGGPGYAAALYIAGSTSRISFIDNNVILDIITDAIKFESGTDGASHPITLNALCSVPGLELRNSGSLINDAPSNWWSTNTPVSGTNYTGIVTVTSPITLSIITLTNTLPADGFSTMLVTITFRDPFSNTVPHAPARATNPPAPNARQIALATSLGNISPAIVEVDDHGVATATLTSARTTGTAIITATAFCNYPVTSTVLMAATNVAITKTAAVTQVVAGDLLTYTINYSNTSDIDATNVVITDQLPANTIYITDSSGLTRTVSGELVTWTVGTLSPGVNRSFVLTLSVSSSSAACGAQLVNRAGITTTVVETDLNDNNATAPTVSVICADVGIAKTTAMTQVVPGNLLTYTIVYSNAGLATAMDVVITDSLPAGTIYVTDTSGLTRTQTGRLITWARDSLNPAPPSFPFNLVLSVPNDSSLCGRLLTNTAGIATTTPESNTLPNFAASQAVTVTCYADLAISKFPTPTHGLPTDPITFTIVYTNNGPNAATDVTITDTLPISTSYVSDTSGRTPIVSNGMVTWTGFSLDVGQTFSFTLRLNYQGPPCQAMTLTNTVGITSTTLDPGGSNNVFTATYQVDAGGACVDVLVIKNDDVGPTTPNPNAPLSPDKQLAIDRLMDTFRALAPSAPAAHREFARPGELVTYTIAVVNNSTYTATQFVLTETLPIYSDYIGYEWTQLSARTFTQSVGTLLPGEGRAYYFVVRVQDMIPVRNITNTICGFGAELDLNPADNCWIEDTPIRPWELLVSKSVSNQCIVPGDSFNYDIRYTNTTTDTTFFNTLITDTLPFSVTHPGPDNWQCDTSGRICTQNVPVISPSISGTLPLPVRVDWPFPSAETSLTNTVQISGGNVFTLVTPIWTGADLSVVKNDNIGPLPLALQARWEEMQSQVYGAAQSEAAQANRLFARPGELITYTILYVNKGASLAHNVVVTERLPLYTSYVGGGWTPAGGLFYTVTLGTLAPHEGGELSFIVRVNDPFPFGVDRVINRVDIGGTDAECNTDNNWSADDTPIVQNPFLTGIWATGRDSNNVVLLNSATMQVISNVVVGKEPFGLARDDQRLYVANFGSDNLSVLDETGNILATVQMGTRPSFVEAMDGYVYVTNYAWPGWTSGGGVTRYYPQTGATEQLLSSIPGFFGIAKDPVHHRIFAANRGFGRDDPNAGIYLIDQSMPWGRKIITTLDPDTGHIEQPYEIAYSADSDRLYVIMPTLNRVWVYDVRGSFGPWPSYRLPIDTRMIGCQLTSELEVNGGEGIAIKNGLVYVSNYCGSSVTVIRDSPIALASNGAAVAPGINGSVVLPYQIWLPVVFSSQAGPSVLYTVDLPPRISLTSQGTVPDECNPARYCPKGIAFANGRVYISLFRSNSLAIITLDPMPPQVVTVMPVTGGDIAGINQLLGEP